MVRNYKPKPKPYNDATLRLALKEVQDGVSIRIAATNHSIGYGKLWKEYQGLQQAGDAYEPQMHRGKKVSAYICVYIIYIYIHTWYHFDLELC